MAVLIVGPDNDFSWSVWMASQIHIMLNKPEHSMPSKRLPLHIQLKKPEHSPSIGLSKTRELGIESKYRRWK